MVDIQPSPKLVNILYALAHGRLPWGQRWDAFIPLCETSNDDGEPCEAYILCCGHTLQYPHESSPVVGAGLMLPGKPDRFGRPTLAITKAGRAFLDEHIGMAEIAA